MLTCKELRSRLCLFCGILALTLHIPAALQAQGPGFSPQEILARSTQGREFWFAIPPNETLPFPFDALEIYVTSAVDTEVTLEHPGSGFKVTKNVRALEITTFSNAPGADNTTNWAWEVREHGVVGSQAIRITAPDPVSVYTLNAKPTTSEGFLVLPKRLLGNDYIHVNYNDLPESERKRGNGFIIVGTVHNTSVTVQLKGTADTGRTTGNRKPGDSWTFVLNRGQTYSVKGNGEDVLFDLTGSRITSNHAIGLISYHERAIIPISASGNSRDHLAEMLPPVSSWGKTYITKEIERENRGDFFRIIAAEDDTFFQLDWFDKKTGSQIAHTEGLLSKSGDIQQWLEVRPDAHNPNGPRSVRGVSVWTADKPVLVMHYSYSAVWDGSTRFDPFMVLTTPVEQYSKQAIFQTPATTQFTNNFLTVLAQADTDDPEQLDLKSIMLDGEPLATLDKGFLGNRIPGTNVYWATVNVAPDAHSIVGDAYFGAYIYGFSTFESYGWNATMAVNKIDQLDTAKPVLIRTEMCSEFSYTTTEEFFGAEDDEERQIDQGINAVELLEAQNMQLSGDEIVHIPSLRSYDFSVSVLQKDEEAFAIVGVTDRAGNISVDTISYIPPGVIFDGPEHDFGDMRVGEIIEHTVTMENNGDKDEEIINVTLDDDNGIFTIVRVEVDGSEVVFPFTLAPGAKLEIMVSYQPQSERQTDENNTLLVQLPCDERRFKLSGRGVLPHIAVQNVDFGSVIVGEERCVENGLLIRNTGSGPLRIDGINDGDIVPPFIYRPQTPDIFPVTLEPGAEILVTEFCYRPTQSSDNDILQVTVVSDAPQEDLDANLHIATLRGSSIIVGVREVETGAFTLKPIRPNPAGEFANITFHLNTDCQTRLTLLDAAGRTVAIIADGMREQGLHTITADIGEQPAGLYFFKLEACGFTATQKAPFVR